MNTHRYAWKVLGAGLFVAFVAACSSSTSPSSSSPPSSPAATTPAATATTSAAASGATAAITTNWEAFFSNKTPVTKRVSLLEDGSQFASIIKAQAGSGLAASATAKVVSVSNITATQATVTYDILVSGTPALKNESGTAVYQDGTWKVGATSFCGLLTLEQLKPLPAACSSAG